MTSGKVRMELRFDPNVAEGVKELADEIGVSVNQLLQGLARWAVKDFRSGEPRYDRNGVLYEEKVPGCVWWGKPGFYSDEVVDDPVHGSYVDKVITDKGYVACALDFTERRVVREGKVVDIPETKGNEKGGE